MRPDLDSPGSSPSFAHSLRLHLPKLEALRHGAHGPVFSDGAHLRPAAAPDERRGANDVPCSGEGAQLRPAPAPDEPPGAQCRAATHWGAAEHGADCMRDGVLLRHAAAGVLPRPAPAPDYTWGVLGTSWWRDGAPLRPAPAPDECGGRHRGRMEWLRDGAALRPAPAPDELRGALLAAPWRDLMRLRAEAAAAGS